MAPSKDGFADVLRDFTREVLREQPRSIPDFGAAYFENLLRQATLVSPA